MTTTSGVTFPRVVRAEWTKLRALRSTWTVLALVAIMTVAVAGAVGADQKEPSVAGSFLGVDVFSLVLGVFGILMITGEYGSGLIRATFAAVPHRLPLLGAKAVVLVATAAPIMLLSCVAAYWANRLFAGAASGPAEPEALRATLGAVAAPLGLALVGLGIGALVRHTAAAITTYVLSLAVIPALLQASLPDEVGKHIVRFSPISAAQALYAATPSIQEFRPGPAALTLLAWMAALLTAGAVVMARRDP
jgi:ABC-2 type transport system permease protein